MKKMNHASFCFVILLVLIFGCGKEKSKPEEVSASGTLSVYVVNYPLKYFAERIGGDLHQTLLYPLGYWSLIYGNDP